MLEFLHFQNIYLLIKLKGTVMAQFVEIRDDILRSQEKGVERDLHCLHPTKNTRKSAKTSGIYIRTFKKDFKLIQQPLTRDRAQNVSSRVGMFVPHKQ